MRFVIHSLSKKGPTISLSVRNRIDGICDTDMGKVLKLGDMLRKATTFEAGCGRSSHPW